MTKDALPDDNGSKATLREVIDLLHQLDREWTERFDMMDVKYVSRDVCMERHRHVDPRQIWAGAAAISILIPLVTYILFR